MHRGCPGQWIPVKAYLVDGDVRLYQRLLKFYQNEVSSGVLHRGYNDAITDDNHPGLTVIQECAFRKLCCKLVMIKCESKWVRWTSEI